MRQHTSRGLTTKFGGPAKSSLRCPITNKLLFGKGDNAPLLSVETKYNDRGAILSKKVMYYYFTAG